MLHIFHILLEVDLSLLDTEESVILVKDIKLPTGVKLYHVDQDEVVASTSIAKRRRSFSSSGRRYFKY